MKQPNWKQNLLDLPNYLTVSSVSNGIIAWLFGVSGPLLIVLQSATMGNLPFEVTSSWVFAIYFFGGIASLLLTLYYRQPIPIAFSIPGAVLVGTSLAQHTLSDVIGAYLVTGIVILALGLSGVVKRMMEVLPMPIMMGMVSGVLMPFGVDIVTSTMQAPLVNGTVLGVFIALTLLPRLAQRFPPLLGAILAAFLLLPLTGQTGTGEFSFQTAQPQLFAPTFHWGTIGELVIPLMLTVIAIQNAQGIAVLRSTGYVPPVNAMTNWSGLTSIATSFFGAHTMCVAGPMTAIMAAKETGPQEGRYAASVVNGGLWILFGIFAPIAASITLVIPATLIKLLGGLAMIGVLVNSLTASFSAQFKVGALFSFLITISGITILNIGAPFWGLVGGTLASLVFERSDFLTLRKKEPAASEGTDNGGEAKSGTA